jgi:hypothetical protein
MNKEIVKNEKELVIARLDAMPENTKLSLGSLGTFSKEELIDRVNKYDDVGKKIIEIEISFLKALSTGKLYAEIPSNNKT